MGWSVRSGVLRDWTLPRHGPIWQERLSLTALIGGFSFSTASLLKATLFDTGQGQGHHSNCGRNLGTDRQLQSRQGSSKLWEINHIRHPTAPLNIAQYRHAITA